MLLLEHQGKAFLRRYGIGTPRGIVVTDEEGLEDAIRSLSPSRLVLKAQVATGGRGKAGGIAFAETPAAVRTVFEELRTCKIGGLAPDSVLIEERVDYLRERFAALSIEDGEIRLLFGRAGGIDLEEITARDPGNLATLAVNPIAGPQMSAIAASLGQLGISDEYHTSYYSVACGLFDLAQSCDALLVEINPLVELPGARLLALDARIGIDDDALARHPEIAALAARQAEPTAPTKGGEGLKFKKNPEGGGTIGLIGLGGGLNVALMDWIANCGARVATLVDIDPAIGSGRSREGFAAALNLFDDDPTIRAIMINIVTCGYRLDDIVFALLAAVATRQQSTTKPVILHLRGNSMSRTPELLSAAGYSNSSSIAEAVAAVVAVASR